MSSLEEYASHLQSDSSCASPEALKLVASECGIDENVVDFVLENTEGDVRMAAESLRQMRGGVNVPSEKQKGSAEKQKVSTSGAGLHDRRKLTAQVLVQSTLIDRGFVAAATIGLVLTDNVVIYSVLPHIPFATLW